MLAMIFAAFMLFCPTTEVTGRLTTPDGRSVSGAIVTVQGSEIVARSNSFGYYTLRRIPNCGEHTVEFSHRRYTFEPMLLVLPLPDGPFVRGRLRFEK